MKREEGSGVRRIAAHGSWKSPLSAARVAAGQGRISQPRWWRGALYWVEGLPAQAGRQTLMRWRPGAGCEELTPRPVHVRAVVHEYGGGDYGFAGDSLVYVDNAVPGIQRLGEAPVPGALADARYADFAASPDGRWLLAVEERPAEGAAAEPRNCLVAFDLRRGRRLVVFADCDFASSPVFAPDGRRAAFLAWRHPQMPWEGTTLLCCNWGDAGPQSPPQRVAGGAAESVFQPAFAPGGALTFVSDRSGWWNLWQQRGADAVPLCPRAAEFGAPQWALGLSTYGFAADGEILCAVSEGCTARLMRLRTQTGALEDLGLPYTQIDGLRVAEGHAVFIGAGPAQLPALCVLDSGGRCREVPRQAPQFGDALDDALISRPEAIEFPTQGRSAHGFLYRPRNPNFAAPAKERPPLLVKCHGGPTGAANPALDWSVQFWTSRGFALLDVNYAGSAGYGRAYRELLRGRWGELDVADACAAAQFAVQEGLANAAQLAVRGSSAGGYTALCALAFRDVFCAGASHYGIGDLEALARSTHKFESRYMDGLIGSWPAQRELYRARSPLHHAGQITRPVILFQGGRDAIVPPAQAEAMTRALAQRGVPHACRTFASEGHGFRQARNIRRALAAELWFYGRVFGFAVAGAPLWPPRLRCAGALNRASP